MSRTACLSFPKETCKYVIKDVFGHVKYVIT
jgi:hypothetical protein